MNIDIAVLFRAFEGVFTFVLIGCLGYFLAKRGWFSEESLRMLSRLVTGVAIPAYLFSNMTTNFSRDELFEMAIGVLPPFASIGFCLVLSWALTRILNIRDKGLFITGFSCSNSINIGLPINLVLFGPAGIPYVLLYFVANTTTFWSLGNQLIAGDAPGAAPLRNSPLEFLGRIFSPSITAFMIGVAAVALRIPIPGIVARSFELVGGTNAPLVMITLGVTIFQMGLANLRMDRDMLLVSIGRFVISPLTMIAISLVFPMPTLMRNVFIIQSCMPTMNTSVMLAIRYGANVDYATRSVCLTTFLSIIVIPVYMLIAEGMMHP
jgi:predicted permease